MFSRSDLNKRFAFPNREVAVRTFHRAQSSSFCAVEEVKMAAPAKGRVVSKNK